MMRQGVCREKINEFNSNSEKIFTLLELRIKNSKLKVFYAHV